MLCRISAYEFKNFLKKINIKMRYLTMSEQKNPLLRPQGFGIWGEGLFMFRELGSTGNYFQGSGEQAHSFGDLLSPAKK